MGGPARIPDLAVRTSLVGPSQLTRNSRADSAQEIPSSPHPTRAKLSFSASRKTFALPNLAARPSNEAGDITSEPLCGVRERCSPLIAAPLSFAPPEGPPERCSPAVAGPPELRSPQTSWGPPESTPRAVAGPPKPIPPAPHSLWEGGFQDGTSPYPRMSHF